MKVNQCIKTGANVYLTGESVVAHGDLYFISHPGDGVSLVLRYVEPFTFRQLAKDEPWPEEYDAVFDTAKVDQYGTQGFLDLKGAQVMVCHAAAAYTSKNLKLPQGYGPHDDDVDHPHGNLEEVLQAVAERMAEKLGASAGAVSIVRIGRDGSVQALDGDDDEPRGTLQ